MTRFRRAVALATVLAFVTSCTTWRPQTDTPRAVIEGKQPTSVSVLLDNGRRVTVHDPSILNEHLVGWSGPGMYYSRDRSFPLAEVRSVALPEVAKGRTALAVVAVGLTALVVAVAASLSGGWGRSSSQPASCPLIYSRTDEGWRLDSGTFGGAIMRSLRRTDVDNLEFASPRDGVLTLKLANELDETDHVDAIEVIAVDHAPGVTVAPTSAGAIRGIGRLDAPVRASDAAGRDVLPFVGGRDEWSWESRLVTRAPGSAAARDGIDLWFARPRGATAARLVVDARNTPWAAFLLGRFLEAHGRGVADWYDALDADPARARELQAFIAKETFLRVSVETSRGWVESGLLGGAGPEIGKRQLVPIDLRETTGDMVHVRLDAPASLWRVDAVGLDTGAEPAVATQTLRMRHPARSAGADTFDLLTKADGRELILETGDFWELGFDVPPAAPGTTRSFMLRSTGWYRVHTPDTGEPDLPLLASIMKPGGVADWSARLMNAVLTQSGDDRGGRR